MTPSPDSLTELACKHDWSDWKIIGNTGDWFHPHVVERRCTKCKKRETDEH